MMHYKVGWGKSGVLEHKSANMCEMRKIEEKLLWVGGGLEELSKELEGAQRVHIRQVNFTAFI